MPVNWGLAQNYDVGGAVMQGMELGRKQRAETETRNALASLVQNPNDTNALGALAQYDPATAMQFQERNAKVQQEQQVKQSGDMKTLRQLLYTAKDNPQQAFSAAQAMGMDLTGVPNPMDPNFQTWLNDQIFIVDALEKPGGQEALSAAGKMAVDMGFKPGTPEFNAKVGEIFKTQSIKMIAYGPDGGVATYDPGTGSSTQVVVPQSQMPQQATKPLVAQGPDNDDIQMLRGGQLTPAQFDEVFGTGAAERALQGGQTQPASGTFQ